MANSPCAQRSGGHRNSLLGQDTCEYCLLAPGAGTTRGWRATQYAQIPVLDQYLRRILPWLARAARHLAKNAAAAGEGEENHLQYRPHHLVYTPTLSHSIVMTRKPIMGRRRRPQGLVGFCVEMSYFCVALAAFAARAPSKLLTRAFLLNSNPAVRTRDRAPPSACYSSSSRSRSSGSVSSWSRLCSGGSGSSTTLMRASSSLFALEGSGTRSRRGRLACTTAVSQQRGATATTRASTALAAAGSGRSSGDSAGGGDGADEGDIGGVWAVQDEEEWEFEEEVQRLEERLEAAVKHEDYKGAATCRDELYRLVRAISC